MAEVALYDALAADYDRFVNWQARLAHELPFLERLFQVHGVEGILDVACGTGQHAIALAQRGYQVVGADLSAAMIVRARENALAAGVDTEFVVAGLGELAGPALQGPFDAILCLGNSLPHLLTEQAVAEALAAFAARLRPGGLLVIQNRNLDRVWAERERFMPPQSWRDDQAEWLFVRFYDFGPETIRFNMVRLRRTAAGWTQDVESTELRPIFQADLARGLAQVGLADASFYGAYDGSAFDPQESGDLIAVALREG